VAGDVPGVKDPKGIDVKVAWIDATWSGLKLVIRVTDRR